MPWLPVIEWETPAGRVLRTLLHALPAERQFDITLFGSSPLQLGLEATFLSEDIDLFDDQARDELSAMAHRLGVDDPKRGGVYVQICTESNFRTSPRWRTRAFTTRLGNVTLTLPHPLDLLIAKLHRLADKDLRAFRLVIERTGHPTEAELRAELQIAVDLYRPNFDEEMIGDITTNTRVLWQELWEKEIDVRKEIIAPALALRREGYALDIAREDYKAELRRLANS